MAKCKCAFCISVIMKDRDMTFTDDSVLDYQYIESLSRGGLKYPSLLAILVNRWSRSAWSVFMSAHAP